MVLKRDEPVSDINSKYASHRKQYTEFHIVDPMTKQLGLATKELLANTGCTGRIAIVLRAWDDYEYTERRLAWLRALISEVSLQRAGRYQVFFLVNVKNSDVHLEDDAAYEQAMLEFVPEEFHDMAIPFNERTLKAWYPLVQEHGFVNLSNSLLKSILADSSR